MRRVGAKGEGRFERIAWDDAIATITGRFKQITDEWGAEAILPYNYLAHMGVVATRYADRLWNRMGTARVGMEICAMAGAFASNAYTRSLRKPSKSLAL